MAESTDLNEDFNDILSIEGLCDRLESKGLVEVDKEELKRFIHETNYKNIVKYFESLKNDGKNTLDSLLSAYHTDDELRSILFKYILKIEKMLKRVITSKVSENINNGYILESSQVQLETYFYYDKYLKIEEEIKSKVVREYSFLDSNSYDDYESIGKNIPIWEFMDYLSLGDVKDLLFSIKDEYLKRDFLNEYSKLTEINQFKHTIGLIRNIKSVHQLRNICGHGGILYDFDFKISPKLLNNEKIICEIKVKSKFGVTTTQITKKLFPVFVSMLYLLRKRDRNLLIAEVCILFYRNNSTDMKKYGFKKDWDLKMKI